MGVSIFLRNKYSVKFQWVRLVLPLTQRFLSGMYSRIYEVMHMACQSVCLANISTTRLTRCMNDFTNTKSHARKKPLPSG